MTLSSCPDERVLSIHADGELPRAQAVAVTAHVAACASCAEQLAALRVEDVLLRELLEQPFARPALAAAAPRRELAVCGLLSLPAVALMAAGLAVLGALQLPTGLEWLDPVRGFPQAWVYAVGLWLVDHGPGLRDAVLSVGAVLALTSIAGLVVAGQLGRGGARVLAAGLALCALLPTSASALEFRRDEREVRIASGERIDEPLAVGTQVFELDGEIGGDLLVAAQTIRLRGRVDGNVFAAGEVLELSEGARIEGSLFFGGETLDIEGAIRDSSYSLTSRFQLAASATVGRTVAALADLADLNGHVGVDAFLTGERARVSGRVERDLVAWRTDVSLAEGAVVGRNLDAWLGDEDELALDAGAQVLGETRRHPSMMAPASRMGRYAEPGFYLRQLVELGAALLVGLLLLHMMPELAYASVRDARGFFTSAGLGFLALIAVPVAAVIIAITVIGIPLALIALGVYLIVLYLAQVPVAAWIGAALVGPETERLTTGQLALPLFLGLLLLHIAANLPYVGIPIGLLTVLVGLGLLAREARELWRDRAERSAQASLS